MNKIYPFSASKTDCHGGGKVRKIPNVCLPSETLKLVPIEGKAGTFLRTFSSMEIFEIFTKFSSLSLQCKLPLQISQKKLLADYYNVIKEFGGEQHSRHDHHDGGWKAIGLITSGGEVYTDKFIHHKPFLETPAMQMCPYIKEILSIIPGSKRRVRLMFLEPGSIIKWHIDRTDTIDGAISSRFHIPIITSSKIEFSICHNRCHWTPGHIYYGDFSFPHQVRNNWDQRRVHLVIDMVPNDDLRLLLPEAFRHERGKREFLRMICRNSYLLQYQIPQKLKKVLELLHLH